MMHTRCYSPVLEPEGQSCAIYPQNLLCKLTIPLILGACPRAKAMQTRCFRVALTPWSGLENEEEVQLTW